MIMDKTVWYGQLDTALCIGTIVLEQPSKIVRMEGQLCAKLHHQSTPPSYHSFLNIKHRQNCNKSTKFQEKKTKRKGENQCHFIPEISSKTIFKGFSVL